MYLEKVNDFIEENSFLNETVEQLEKDFLMVGVNFDVPSCSILLFHRFYTINNNFFYNEANTN